MNKKNIFPRIISTLFCLFLLTSCGPAANGGETSSSSSSHHAAPTVSADDFSDLLQKLLLNESQSKADFEITEIHQYDPSSSMERRQYAKWISDLSDRESPKFSYSAQRNPNAEDPEVLFFYDNGYFYLKDSENQYRHPASLPQAIGKIPFNALSAIFGEELGDVFLDADVTENGNGTFTANINVSLDDFAESVIAYLRNFGIDASGVAYETDTEISPLCVSVTLSDKSILSYRLETVMQILNSNHEIYPATYTVSAVYHEIGEDFSVPLPDDEARKAYREAESEIESITAEEFLKRFERSDEKGNAAVYTEMITNATASYEFSNGTLVRVPLLNVTALDLSKPRAPKISIVETKDMMGLIQKTEIYYKDDMYYYSFGGKRFSKPYPAEEYLANVEASAKEKEEAGISTIFLTEDMLKDATLTVNPDQSVTAFMQFDGRTQEKNIFYHINSLYNDDLSEMPNVQFLETTVCVTVDRFNYLRTYTLSVTVASESKGQPVIMKYTVEYRYGYDENPREIRFPDDLDAWGSPA